MILIIVIAIVCKRVWISISLFFYSVKDLLTKKIWLCRFYFVPLEWGFQDTARGQRDESCDTVIRQDC